MTKPHEVLLPFIVIVTGVAIFFGGGWLWLSEPVNSEHYAKFLLDAPSFVYTLLDVSIWLGPLLFLLGILMLIFRTRKNDENIHRR